MLCDRKIEITQTAREETNVRLPGNRNNLYGYLSRKIFDVTSLEIMAHPSSMRIKMVLRKWTRMLKTKRIYTSEFSQLPWMVCWILIRVTKPMAMGIEVAI